MTAIRMRHRGIVYRLLSFKQTSDWSLVIAWNRPSPLDPKHHRFSSDDPTPIACDPPTADKRLTYHITGQVNYHGWVHTPPRFIEPPHALTQRHLLIAVSLVHATTLMPLVAKKRRDEVIVDLADDIGDARFTFGILAGQLGFENPPNTLFRLDYDLFSIICVTMPPPYIPNTLEHHNVYMAPEGPLSSRAIEDIDVAMLAYHQARIGHSGLGVYPPDGDGVYSLFTSVLMRAVPNLRITFSEPGYHIEVIRERARPMFVPFRIFRGDQRITRGDLRTIITAIEVESEL
jgi:hypothetical protein